MGYRKSVIDILKGVCICFVVITHFSWSSIERLQYGFPFWIDMAVPIFMFISGYVYATSYEKRKVELYTQVYSVEEIFKKIARYTIPFLPVYSFIVLINMIKGKSILLKEIVFGF